MCNNNAVDSLTTRVAKESSAARTIADERTQLQEDNPDALILQESGGSSSGSKNLAKVARAEWEDYLSRFAPVENMLFDKFEDEAGREEMVGGAGEKMGLAFDRSKAQTDQTMSRYGLNISDRQQKQRDQEFEVTKAAGVAGAKNSMRDATEDQKMGIMAGGLQTVKSEV